MKGGDSISVINAGLPNITGDFSLRPDAEGSQSPTGAFTRGRTGSNINQTVAQEVQFKECIISFDASRISAIYGGATTVQPPAITLLPQIRY